MASFSEIPLTHTQHDCSIAEIVIFSIPLLIRGAQAWHGEDNDKRPLLRRIRGDGIILFCLVRIVGAALYLAAKSPTDSILIGALILESLGSSILMGELTRLLVRYLDRPGKSTIEPHRILRRSIQLLRIPILLAMVLFIVSYNVSSVSTYKGLVEAAAILMMAIFVIVVGLYIYMGTSFRVLVGEGMTSFTLAALSLPFLFVRMLYLILSAFRVDDGKFIIIFGDWKIYVGMSLLMEVVVVALLVAAGIVESQHSDYLASNRAGELEQEHEQVKQSV